MDKPLESNLQLSVGDSFSQILLLELKSIKKWRKIAIKGTDPEGVHQIRVSLRKMRTALFVFKPVLNTQYSRRLAKDIRKFSKILDDARDLDVYLLNNFSEVKQQSTLHTAAIIKRDNAYQKSRKLFKSKVFNQCLYEFKNWLKHTKWKKQLSKCDRKAAMLPIRPFAILTLDQLRNDIIANANQIESLQDIQLHRLRILCKKLRYTTEFFSSVDNKPTKVFIEQLKHIQDSLGDIHDCFVVKQLHQKLALTAGINDEMLTESHQIEADKIQFSEATKNKLPKDFSTFCQCTPPWRPINR